MNKKVSGFTLIELLVVISLIGIIATFLLANFNAARERGRDAQRKADLRNLQTALRLYYNDNGGYPPSNASFQIMGCGTKAAPAACNPAWGGTWALTGGPTYMSVMAKDPLSPTPDYRYVQTDSDNYTLTACLENLSDDKGKTDASATWCPTLYVYEVKP